LHDTNNNKKQKHIKTENIKFNIKQKDEYENNNVDYTYKSIL